MRLESMTDAELSDHYAKVWDSRDPDELESSDHVIRWHHDCGVIEDEISRRKLCRDRGVDPIRAL